MSDLSRIANLPDVKGVVLADLAGGFHDVVREPDAESVAAVMGFVASALRDAGGELGLGGLRRVAVAGERRGWLVAIEGDLVLAASVEPGRSLAAVEKAFDSAAERKV